MYKFFIFLNVLFLLSLGCYANTFTIGIAGGSASGKTYLAEKLASHLGNRIKAKICVVSQDWYYLPFDLLPKSILVKEPPELASLGLHNFDDPKALDEQLILEHLNLLQNGQEINIPNYNFETNDREKSDQFLANCKVIIYEGTHALYWPRLRELLDYTLFVDLSSSVRLNRKVIRDRDFRKRSEEDTLLRDTFIAKRSFEKFIYPTRLYRTEAISGFSDDKTIEALSNRVYHELIQVLD